MTEVDGSGEFIRKGAPIFRLTNHERFLDIKNGQKDSESDPLALSICSFSDFAKLYCASSI